METSTLSGLRAMDIRSRVPQKMANFENRKARRPWGRGIAFFHHIAIEKDSNHVRRPSFRACEALENCENSAFEEHRVHDELIFYASFFLDFDFAQDIRSNPLQVFSINKCIMTSCRIACPQGSQQSMCRVKLQKLTICLPYRMSRGCIYHQK